MKRSSPRTFHRAMISRSPATRRLPTAGRGALLAQVDRRVVGSINASDRKGEI